MILRTITVSGWRCYAAAVTLGPFADGINVIHAPNGVGKSTLFEALQRGLLDSHRVQGESVRLLQPWGRELAPSVAVEFEHEGDEYRVEKRFLNGASSELLRRENGAFNRLSEGREADNRVREMLLGDAAGRGLTKPAQWGIAQVLWVPQGDLAFDELSGGLTKTISEMLGAQISGLEGGALEQRVEQEYLKYFTAAGKLRGGRDAPAHVALAGQLSDLEQQRLDLTGRLEAFDEASRQVEDCRVRLAQYDARCEELVREIAECRKEAARHAELVKVRGQRQLEASEAQREFESCASSIDRLAKLRGEARNGERERQRLESEVAALERDDEHHTRQQSRAHAELLTQRARRDDVERRFNEAEAARRFHELTRGQQQLSRLSEQSGQLQKQIVEAERRLSELLAPDDGQLRAIQVAQRAYADAHTRLDAVLLRIELIPAVDGWLEVLAGEETGGRDVRAGVPITINGSPELAIDWQGVGQIRASGPQHSAAELRSTRDAAAARLEQLCRPFACDDIAELERRHTEGSALRGHVGELRARREVLLDGRDDQKLASELAAVSASREKLLREHSGWVNSPPDADELLAAAKQTKDAFQLEIDRLELRQEEVVRTATAAKERLAAAKATLSATKRHGDDVRAQIDVLVADGRDDAARERRRSELSLAWLGAKEAVEAVGRKLDAFAQQPDDDLARLESQLEATRTQQRDLAARQHQAQGRLDAIQRESPYSALGHVEEQIAVLSARIELERQRGEAIKLLRDTIHDVRQEVFASVARPIEVAATRMLERIAGGRLGRVCLDNGLAPRGVVPRISETDVSVETLSGGEQEQIYFATRLSLAERVAERERQLVVLDDVLTATDAGRLMRIQAILEEATDRLQVLILTCHPERYAGLGGCVTWDLEAAIEASRATVG
ncbi:MAG: AAA family ATPase [Pirellulales bacterium]